jgi:hypothetical protein
MLLTEIVVYKATVQAIQERYFDNHPILCRRTETTLETTIQMVRDVIVLFNEDRADPLSRALDRESENTVTPGESQSNLSIDIEVIEERAKLQADTIIDEWTTTAKKKSTEDVLEITGEHQDFVWQNFRKLIERYSTADPSR